MDPQTDAALLGALAGAALGVLGTYVFDLRKAQRARAQRIADEAEAQRRHRATVATALLHDLRRLEFSLHEVYDVEDAATVVVARPPLYYDVLRGDSRLFSPGTIEPLSTFFDQVDHLFGSFQALRAIGPEQLRPSPRRNYEVRCHAAFALQALPRAFDALVTEGGVVDEQFKWSATLYPQLPAVPEPRFGPTKARAASRRDSRGA